MKLQMLFLLSTLFLFDSAPSKAGQDMVITLTDTLYGDVQIDFTANMILVGKARRYQCLTVSQVVWIRKGDHEYCVAAFGLESSYFIFEVLSKGKKPLLYREGVKFNPYGEEAFPPFFVLANRSAFSVGTKKEVLSVFGANQKQIRAFAKTNGLSFSSRQGLSRMFNYYNDSK